MRNLILFTLISLLASSCITDYDGDFFGSGIKGEGPAMSRTYDVEGFKALKLDGSGDYYLSQGEEYAVKVESHENILDVLEVETSGDGLEIGFKKSVSSYETLKFYITLPELEGISLAGSGDVTGETAFGGINTLELNIAGSGDIKLEAEARSIEANIAGSGDVELSGSADNMQISIMGSGNVNAAKLSLQRAEISIAGSGSCELDVSEKLDVSIAGSGDVYYTGSPEITKSIAGSGEVKKK